MMQPGVYLRSTGCIVLRRDFGKASLGVIGSTVLGNSTRCAEVGSRSGFPKPTGLTNYVGKFVVDTKYGDIPEHVIEGRADFGKGRPANPMTFEEAATNFKRCAEFAEWPKAKTEKIIEFAKGLDSALDVRALSPLLSARKE